VNDDLAILRDQPGQMIPCVHRDGLKDGGILAEKNPGRFLAASRSKARDWVSQLSLSPSSIEQNSVA
jgi:hypothetical protein